MKFNVTVRVITGSNTAAWRTVDHKIPLRMPVGSFDWQVRIAAQERASKRWRNCWVTDIQPA